MTEGTVVQGDDQRREALAASRGQSPPELPGYQLTHCLGSGSFGEVWGGERLRTGQQVAVKILKSASSRLESFRHELDRLREVSQHSHIVGLVDADLSNDPPFLAMLRMPRALPQAVPIEREQALLWFEHLLLALDYTHRKGLLHCDIKPSNLLIDEDDRLCLADFGQSRFLSGTQGGAWGTLGWMPPEQAQMGQEGSSPNVAWDIYAAGAVAYWMLSGRCPRQMAQRQAPGGDAPKLETYAQDLRSTPLVPLQGLDRDLKDIISSCLALDPERRPRSVGEILQDLQRRRQRLPLLCRRPWSAVYLTTRALQRPAVVVPLALALLLLGSLAWANRSLRGLNDRLGQTLQKENEVNASLLFEKGLALEETQPTLARLWWLEALRRRPHDFVFRYRLQPTALSSSRELTLNWKWNGWPPVWTARGLAFKTIGSLGDTLTFWKVAENQHVAEQVPGFVMHLSEDGKLCSLRWLDQSHTLYDLRKKATLRPLSGPVLAWRGDRIMVSIPGVASAAGPGVASAAGPGVASAAGPGVASAAGPAGATLETVDGKVLERINEPVQTAEFSPDGSAYLVYDGSHCSLRGSRFTPVNHPPSVPPARGETRLSDVEGLNTPVWTGSEAILWKSNRCQLWNWRTHKLLRRFELPEGSFYNLARSPDGKRLVAFGGEEVVIYGFPDLKPQLRLPVRQVQQVQFSQAGKTLLLSGRESFRLVDGATGQAVSDEMPLANAPGWAGLSPDGRWLAAAAEGWGRAWPVPASTRLFDVPRYRKNRYDDSPEENLAGAAYTGEENRLVIVPSLASQDRQSDFLRIIDEDGRFQPAAPKPLAWGDEGRCLVSGLPDRKLAASAVSCVGLEQEHDFPASVSASGQTAVIDTRREGLQLLRDGTLQPLGLKQSTALALRPDGSQLVVADGKRVDLYQMDGATPRPLCHWRVSQPVVRLLWLGDRVLTVSEQDTVCHDLEARQRWRIDAPALVAAPNAESFCTWKADQLTLHRADGSRVAAREKTYMPLYSPDGSVLAVKSGVHHLVLLEPSSLRPLTVPMKHRGDISSIAFDRQSRHVLVSTNLGEVRQWPVLHPSPQETFAQIEARTRLLSPGTLDPVTGTYLPASR